MNYMARYKLHVQLVCQMISDAATLRPLRRGQTKCAA